VKIGVDRLKFYYGDKRALDGISIQIRSNLVTAFIGRRAAAKEHVPAHAEPDERHHSRHPREGTVLIDPPVDLRLRRRRRAVAPLRSAWCSRSRTRSRNRSSRTIAYGLRFNGLTKSKRNGRPRRGKLAQAAIWEEVKDRLHDSALALLGRPAAALCIARALAIRPEILLMDEPASALDPIATQRIEELIYDLKKTYTIVIVTHNMQQAARVSDFTAFFWLGRLVEFDRTDKIFTAPAEKLTEDYVTGRCG
jgi:phosphate transport system ATP-binding protein